MTLSARFDEDKLRVLVIDSGTGIPAEIQDHIFRPYFSTKGNGTGMGLRWQRSSFVSIAGSSTFAPIPREQPSRSPFP